MRDLFSILRELAPWHAQRLVKHGLGTDERSLLPDGTFQYPGAAAARELAATWSVI